MVDALGGAKRLSLPCLRSFDASKKVPILGRILVLDKNVDLLKLGEAGADRLRGDGTSLWESSLTRSFSTGCSPKFSNHGVCFRRHIETASPVGCPGSRVSVSVDASEASREIDREGCMTVANAALYLVSEAFGQRLVCDRVEYATRNSLRSNNRASSH